MSNKNSSWRVDLSRTRDFFFLFDIGLYTLLIYPLFGVTSQLLPNYYCGNGVKDSNRHATARWHNSECQKKIKFITLYMCTNLQCVSQRQQQDYTNGHSFTEKAIIGRPNPLLHQAWLGHIVNKMLKCVWHMSLDKLIMTTSLAYI